MVARARRRPGGERVRWIVGGADGLGAPGADLAIMTGHVAQFFRVEQIYGDWDRRPAGPGLPELIVVAAS
jgi:hypothetical protein